MTNTRPHKEYEELCMKAMCMAFIINQSTDYCVFIHFNAHVSKIEIDIRHSKKRYDERIASTDFDTMVYVYGTDEIDAQKIEKAQADDMRYLKEKLAVLDLIIKEKKVPTDMCDKVVVETIYEYQF